MDPKPMVDWGTQPDTDGVTHSTGLNCRECGWSAVEQGRQPRLLAQQVAGFKSIAPIPGNRGRSHAIVIECPKCFSRFWYHCATLYATILAEHSQEWPTRQ